MPPIVPFLVVAGLLLLSVIAVLSYRLWRAPADTGTDEGVDALGVLRDQRRELDAEVAAGRMTIDEREARIAELTRRVHDEGLLATPATGAAGATDASGVTTARSHRKVWLAALIALLVPVIAIPIYLVIGNPAALDPAVRASAGPAGHGDMTEEQIKTILAQLREKLDKNPDDVKGWTMLGRGLRLVNDFAGSAQAFEKASGLEPNDASLLADWADSLGMTQNRSLEGKPRELIQRALKVDPNYPKALALAASVEYAAGKFPDAKRYWERLLAALPPDAESATEVREILAQLDKRMGVSGAAVAQATAPMGTTGSAVAQAPSTAPTATTSRSASTAAGSTSSGAAGTQTTKATTASAAPANSPSKLPTGVAAITGTVKISSSLASKIGPDDVLFIFARAVDGPRMPLAIIRAKAGELPKTFRLDDSMAMSGGPSLSSIAQVKVEARVSKAGDAMARPGDLRGESAIVSPGMSNIDVVIDRVIP